MIQLTGTVLSRLWVDTPLKIPASVRPEVREKLLEGRAKRTAEGRDRETLYLVVLGSGAGQWSSRFTPHCIATGNDSIGLIESFRETHPDSTVHTVIIKEGA